VGKRFCVIIINICACVCLCVYCCAPLNTATEQLLQMYACITNFMMYSTYTILNIMNPEYFMLWAIIYLLLNHTQGTSKKNANTDTKKKQK